MPVAFSPPHSLRRAARVKPKRDGLFVVVERTRRDGAHDFFTGHFTRWGARLAAWAYRRNGRMMGLEL